MQSYAPEEVHDDELCLVAKHGGDGAGSQAIWKSVSMSGAEAHMFQYGLVPLRLETTTGHPLKVLWRNPCTKFPTLFASHISG